MEQRSIISLYDRAGDIFSYYNIVPKYHEPLTRATYPKYPKEPMYYLYLIV